MQTQQTITVFGIVSNVVAWGKEGHFAKSLQVGTRIKLVVQAQYKRHKGFSTLHEKYRSNG